MSKKLVVFTDDSDILNGIRSCFEPEFSIYMASDIFSLTRLTEGVYPSVIFVDSKCVSRFEEFITGKFTIPVLIFDSGNFMKVFQSAGIPLSGQDSSFNRKFEISHGLPAGVSDRKRTFAFPSCLSDFSGTSEAVIEFKKKLIRAAGSDLPVLFTGGSGSGKTIAARALHLLSKRSKKNFFKVNISAIPASLAESELFGSVKGAFTDSVVRDGYFLSADGGTLFLDEIGDAELDVQKKLLHVIESGEFRKVGSDKTEHTDIRMIFATNANLQNKVLLKEFRSDLLYRITSIVIKVPQLTERKSDIPALCEQFFRKNNIKKNLHQSSILKLKGYEWPGNVRELHNCLERAVFNSEESPTIFPEHIVFF